MNKESKLWHKVYSMLTRKTETEFCFHFGDHGCFGNLEPATPIDDWGFDERRAEPVGPVFH